MSIENGIDPSIILSINPGDDYSVLDNVNPNIKNKNVELIEEVSDENLADAIGPTPNQITPGQKYFILKQLGFKSKEQGKWKHESFEELIDFDIHFDSLIQLAFRIFEAGYHTAK